MAVQPITIADILSSAAPPDRIPVTSRSQRFTWSGLENGDSGRPLISPHLNDKSVQVLGTFGVGGTLIIEGSNDGGTTYVTLTDEQGSALSFTTAGLKTILQNVEVIRPRVTGGDGDTDLTVCLVASGTN